MSKDTISRQAVIEINKSYHGQMPNEVNHRIWKEINELPSAQPEHTNSWCINSWCIDCKEYDTENKCCHRYNSVIKQTLDEIYSHAEIVRCKDCKHHDGIRCFRWNSTIITKFDDFCSNAERRTDE